MHFLIYSQVETKYFKNVLFGNPFRINMQVLSTYYICFLCSTVHLEIKDFIKYSKSNL